MEGYVWTNTCGKEKKTRSAKRKDSETYRDDKARNYGTRETKTETEREEKVGEKQQEKRERDQVGSQVTQRQGSEGVGGFAPLPEGLWLLLLPSSLNSGNCFDFPTHLPS